MIIYFFTDVVLYVFFDLVILFASCSLEANAYNEINEQAKNINIVPTE